MVDINTDLEVLKLVQEANPKSRETHSARRGTHPFEITSPRKAVYACSKNDF